MAKSAPVKVTAFEFPVGGLVTVHAVSDQPAGTTPDCLNVVPFEPLTGRGRGGQRPGVSVVSTFPDNKPSQLILQTDIAQTVVPSGAPVTLLDETWGHFATGDLATVAAAVWAPSTNPTGGQVTNGVNQFVQATGHAYFMPSVAALVFDPTLAYSFELVKFHWTTWTATNSVKISMESSGGGSDVLLRLAVGVGLTFTVQITWGGNLGGSGASSIYTIPGYTLGTDVDIKFVMDGSRNASVQVNGVTQIAPIAIPAPFPGDTFAEIDVSCTGSSFTFGEVNFKGQAAPPSFITTNQLVQRAIHVTGGNIYVGTITSMTLATGGGAIFNPYQLLSGDFGEGSAYIVDGTVTKAVDIFNGTVTDLVATGGKGTVPAGCRIAVVWNDRLVLANQDSGPQNIFASRQGDFHDWLFGAVDAQTPWALNASGNFGHVGQAVYALAPITSDIMVIGCASSLYVMLGDPGYGGSIKLASPAIGIIGQNAWCVDEKGSMYFVGSGGFWKLNPKLAAVSQGENGMENLSEGKVPQFFSPQDYGTLNTFVRWDHDRRGVWIYFTQRNGTAGTHLFWDSRTGGFFPQQFVPTKIGPSFATPYLGTSSGHRGILLGGNDSNLRILDPNVFDDDGNAVSSHVVIGPKPMTVMFDQRIILNMEFWMGAAPALPNLSWQMQVGHDAESSLAGTTVAGTGTFTTPGRQTPVLTRGRGVFGTLLISNATMSKAWTFEQVAVTTAYGGINR